MILIVSTAIMLMGCRTQKVADDLKTTEALVVQEITQVELPKAEEIVLPKVASIHYLGKDLWNENLVTETKILNMATAFEDTLIFSLSERIGVPHTDSQDNQSRLLKFPNSAQVYLNEKSGESIDKDFTQVNKVMVEEDNTLLLAGSNSANSGMKVGSYQLSLGDTHWKVMGGTKGISGTDGEVYYAGEASDIIKSSDGGIVYISNIPDAMGVNKSYVTKVEANGLEIWHKELPIGLYLERLVEGETPDTVLILAETIEEGTSSVLKVEKGSVVQSLQLSFRADSIKKVGKHEFFILGTDHKDEVFNFIPIQMDTMPVIAKIDSALNMLYTYSNGTLSRLSDFIPIGEHIYLFVGNEGLTSVVAAFYDSGKTLELIKKEGYPNMGQPSQIISREIEGGTEYVMSGLNYFKQEELMCTYSWVAHLYPLKPALGMLYDEKADGGSNEGFLERGEPDRTAIAYAIAKYQEDEELMYIRYLKSDEGYAFVITGEWYNSQIIHQYLLKKDGETWQVLEKFGVTDRVNSKIQANHPGVPLAILPPFEVADYLVKVLDDQQLKAFIAMVDKSKLVGDISFCSYIGDYFYVLFEDGSDYLITNPENKNKEIYNVHPWIPYNYYLINDGKPPYFIFIQN